MGPHPRGCGPFAMVRQPWHGSGRLHQSVNRFASAIDIELPVPPERTHLMLGSKASWVLPEVGPNDKTFDFYPEESLAEWHQWLGLVR